jgi:hypothetical protein
MNIELLRKRNFPDRNGNDSFQFNLSKDLTLDIYPKSLNEMNGVMFFIAREGDNKFLYLLSPLGDSVVLAKFDGEPVAQNDNDDGFKVKRCPLNHHNVLALQEIFEFTRPSPIGLTNSFGFGDRLGLANPGHIRALDGYNYKPILAQQSIREMTRTNRTPADVMDAAVWAVFQEGYEDGFGADADHLKTTDDVDRLVEARYTMFTIDPSDHVVNGVATIADNELSKEVNSLPWKEFGDSLGNILDRYENKTVKLSGGGSITVMKREVLEACLKYTAALIHIKKVYDHLKIKYARYDYEIEVSIDESETVTTPFEHFFIVSALKRMGVKFISLAPRFVGDFEKGIEYKGDIALFKSHYTKHLAIAEHFGFYKISFHSGSDKFRVYEAVGSIHRGIIHVKTAGTSYLEALKVVAIREPSLFREILDFAIGLFEIEKKSYFVSADIKKIMPAKNYKDAELEVLFSSDDVRQVLHVTYGRVLTEKNDKGEFTFRDRIYKCLNQNEDLHYELLIKHFRRHLEPIKKLS